MVPPSLRQALPADFDFIYRVYDTTLRPHVESVGRRWATARMREKCEHDACDLGTSIIEIDGEDAGVFRVERGETEVWLDALLLLPAFQRRGIGTLLLRQVAADAASRRLPLRLNVFFANPAKEFWLRHGFVVCSEADFHIRMERAADYY